MKKISRTLSKYLLLVLSVTQFSFLTPSAALAAPIPSNKLGIRMDSFVLDGAYSVVNGVPTGAGQMKNGNVGAYPEGACVPVVVEIENRDNNAGDAIFSAEFDYFNAAVGITDFKVVTSTFGDPRTQTDNLNDFSYSTQDISTITSFVTVENTTVSSTISGPFSGGSGTSATTPTDATRHYNFSIFNIPAHETVRLLFCAQLGVDAGQYGGGASMSIRTGNGGAENVAIMAQQLLLLPSLTITKTVVGGSATSSDWTFTVSPSINGQSLLSIATGSNSLTINNIPLNGTYTVTENPGPQNYQLSSASGTNCVFSQGTSASATVAAAKPAVNASCEFVNTFVPPVFQATTGTLTVVKVVVNDDGGQATTSSFPLFVNQMPVMSGVATTVASGTYSVTETGTSTYAASFSGDCDQQGNVSVAPGDSKTCTLTNNDIASTSTTSTPPFVTTTGTLIVVKQVINNNGGTSTSADFSLHVTGTSPSMDTFAGSASGTTIIMGTGTYVVTETSSTMYTPSFSADCVGFMAVGETKTCTVTNDDLFQVSTGTLTVIKQVVNDDNGTSTASDFTLHVSGTNPSVSSFSGSSSGTKVILDAGAFSVSETTSTEYAATFGSDCSGMLNAGETKTCIVTNNDIGSTSSSTSTAQLLVIKQVINDSNGTSTASDFTLTVTSTSATQSFVGSSSGTLLTIVPGAYEVSELDSMGYLMSTSSDCIGTINGGETKTCIITNNDPFVTTTGTLIVTKFVINDNGGTKVSSDFMISVTGTQPSTTTFAGNASGTSIILQEGVYEVTELNTLGYTVEYLKSCSGSIMAGQTISCIITNNDPSNGGGNGGGGNTTSTTSTPPIVNNPPSSGGGGVGGGSGSLQLFNFVPNSTAPSTPTTLPTPQVLGVQITAPDSPTSSSTTPTPRVLGINNVTELPRTGMALPLFALSLLFSLAFQGAWRQRSTK